MNPFHLGLSACLIAASVVTEGHAEVPAATQIVQANDFKADRWTHFTAAFQAWAGVAGESNAGDLLLLNCVERDRRMAVSFHPAEQSGPSLNAGLTLAFDGGAPVDAAAHATETISKDIIFLLLDRDPNFHSLVEQLMSSKTLEIAIVQSGTVKSRHTFTLNGASEAITPAQDLCGH